MDDKLIYLARRNPAVRLEDWPGTWRSHAIFAGRFPMLHAGMKELSYCSRIVDPTIHGRRIELSGMTNGYDGAAVISMEAGRRLGAALSEEHCWRIFEHEQRVFNVPTHSSILHARETVVLGGDTGEAAVLRFLTRAPALSPEAFIERLDDMADRHAAAARHSGGVRHVHNHIPARQPAHYSFDAVTETWFACAEQAIPWAAGAAASVAADLSVIVDRDRCAALLTHVIHHWKADDRDSAERSAANA